MYNTMSMPPPWAWGYPPMQPQNNAPDLNTIREWAKTLKEWEKDLKGKDEKKPEGKGPSPSVISMMLFMLLMSPITGGLVFELFKLTLRNLHQ